MVISYSSHAHGHRRQEAESDPADLGCAPPLSPARMAIALARQRKLICLAMLTLSLTVFFHWPPSFQRDVTVQLFQWSHDDVAKECEEHLGPAGYRWAQVSPPQESVSGSQWWVDYQPVSYILHSKRGTPEQFAIMVNRCKAAGIGIIVDAVMNHMTSGLTPGRGFAGSSHSHYEYPDIYNHHDFHHCGRNGNHHISNYTDRYEIQHCELFGLADLATETAKVRDTLGVYLERLAQLGVSGFRVDAAKHMPSQDINAILDRVSSRGRMRVVQEVVFGSSEPIRPEEYMINGNVHLFQGAIDLKRLFKSEGISYLIQPVPWGPDWGDGYLPSSHSTVFVTNHDLERSGISLVSADPQYILAYVFILTYNYGQVDVLSGYNFTGFDDGPIQAKVECGRFGWRCEHRHPMVVGAVKIRNIAGSRPLRNVIMSGQNRAAYARGSMAFVALNNEPEDWVLEPGTQTGLKQGIYPNVMSPVTGPVRVGRRGQLKESVVVPPYSAIGIHR